MSSGIQQMKEMLLNDVDKLVELLNTYDFTKINIRGDRLRFARNDTGGQNIEIRLKNNSWLNCADYARSNFCDVFSMICTEHGVKFGDVMRETKRILGLNSDWRPQNIKEPFGGIYSRICHPHEDYLLPELDECVLNQYIQVGCERFLKDGISLEVQKEFHISYDPIESRIIIPIYDEFSRLVGTKGRYNGDYEADGQMKYLYPNPVPSSRVLFAYDKNYPYMYGNTVILTESEKAPMQSYKYNRQVIGLGGNNVSDKQARLIMQCQPRKVIIALDEGMDIAQTMKCAETIKQYCKLRDTEIWRWDSTQDIDIPSKASCTDLGKEKFNEIIETQLERIY